MGRTSIQVSDDLADELYQRKGRGESYEDVIWRLLDDEPGEEPRSAPVNPGVETPETPTQPPQQDDIGVSIDDIDIPQGVDPDAVYRCLVSVREHLLESGPSTMREIVVDVMPGHSLGYDVPTLEPGERYRGSWWRRVVRPALQQMDDVSSPDPGHSDWSIEQS